MMGTGSLSSRPRLFSTLLTWKAFGGKRDHAMFAILLGCGLRRSELVHLTVEHFQRREDHWAVVDLIGKGGHISTVPVPSWVKASIDAWAAAAQIATGKLFRCVNKTGSVWGSSITEKVVWSIVKASASSAGIDKLAPHDLRRTCARLCHSAGGAEGPLPPAILWMERIRFQLLSIRIA
jgi:site-specific recombinase XerD